MDMSEEVIKLVTRTIVCKVKATQFTTDLSGVLSKVIQVGSFFSPPGKRDARKMGKNLTFVKPPIFSCRFLSSKREGQMSCFLFSQPG